MAITINVAGSYNDKDIKRAQRDLQKLSDASGETAKTFSQKFDSMGRSMSDFGGTMTTHVTLPLLAAGAAVFAAFSEEEEAIARMTGALRANAGQANVTGDEIRNLASQLQKTTTFADDATISAAGLLLTFHNIRNELGDGNKVFDRTLVAAQNLSAALGTDLESATMQLAKALENPATGLTALTRSGTTFTAQQKDMIRTMVDAGDTLGAQRMILDVVESQYGGMAETMAQTTRGKIKQSLNTLGDSMEQFGALLVPMVDKVSEFIKQLGDGLANL
jgi:phage-related minor tail protein